MGKFDLRASKALKMKIFNFELEEKLDLQFAVKFDDESDGDGRDLKNLI